MTVFRVGLTGGLAAGKSTVATWLRDAGFRVIDADCLVAELYRPGAAGTRIVAEMFGPSMLRTDGGVDHSQLAKRVFADPDARHRLEAVIHPLVRQQFENLITGHEGVAVLEATLLVEAGFASDCDLIVTVEAEARQQLRRATERGLATDEARSRMAAQGDGQDRRGAAHRVIWNTGSFEDLRHQVDALIKELSEIQLDEI